MGIFSGDISSNRSHFLAFWENARMAVIYLNLLWHKVSAYFKLKLREFLSDFVLTRLTLATNFYVNYITSYIRNFF